MEKLNKPSNWPYRLTLMFHNKIWESFTDFLFIVETEHKLDEWESDRIPFIKGLTPDDVNLGSCLKAKYRDKHFQTCYYGAKITEAIYEGAYIQ